MKTLSLIPKKIRKQYLIIKDKNCLSVNLPAYVNIDLDDKFRIYQDDSTIQISNSICIVTLWKSRIYMHVTILKATQ